MSQKIVPHLAAIENINKTLSNCELDDRKHVNQLFHTFWDRQELTGRTFSTNIFEQPNDNLVMLSPLIDRPLTPEKLDFVRGTSQFLFRDEIRGQSCRKRFNGVAEVATFSNTTNAVDGIFCSGYN